MIILVAALGLMLSIYLYYVDYKVKLTGWYQPVCDISDSVSCSKAVTSKYGHILHISNALVGIVYYTIVIMLFFLQTISILRIVTILGLIATLILAYISFRIQKNICVVCTSTYIVNFILFYYFL